MAGCLLWANAVPTRVGYRQAMAERCFYKLFGEEFGPVSLEILRDLVSGGQLAGDDEVRMDTRSGWVQVSSVPELNGRGGGGPDRFTPQKTRGLFSSINETVAGTDAIADAGDLEAFSDLGELEIVSESTPPLKSTPARTPASPPSARPTSAPAKAGNPPSPTTRPSPSKGPSGGAGQAAARANPSQRPAAAPPAAPPATPPMVRPGMPIAPMPPGYPTAYQPAPVVAAPGRTLPPMTAAAPPAAADPDRQWYCWTNNQQYGPVTLDTLVQWARSGRLSRNDHIKLTEEGEWLVAGSVEELFSDDSEAESPGKASANVEIRVQSREEFREEKAKLEAAAPVPKVEEEAKPAGPKLAPLMGKDFYKQQEAARKQASGGGEIDRNKLMVIALAVAVPVLLCIYFPPWNLFAFTPFEQKVHDRLRSHYMALREFRTKKDEAGWKAYAQKASGDVKSIADSLKSSAGAEYPARQQLLYAARDHWPKMIEDSSSKAGPGEEEFNKALTSARGEMRKKGKKK